MSKQEYLNLLSELVESAKRFYFASGESVEDVAFEIVSSHHRFVNHDYLMSAYEHSDNKNSYVQQWGELALGDLGKKYGKSYADSLRALEAIYQDVLTLLKLAVWNKNYV